MSTSALDLAEAGIGLFKESNTPLSPGAGALMGGVGGAVLGGTAGLISGGAAGFTHPGYNEHGKKRNRWSEALYRSLLQGGTGALGGGTVGTAAGFLGGNISPFLRMSMDSVSKNDRLANAIEELARVKNERL